MGWDAIGKIKSGVEQAVPVAVSGGVATIDAALGHFFVLALTANAQLNIANPPSGAECLIVKVVQTGAYGLTLPPNSSTISRVPYVVSEGANAVDVLGFMSVDGGATFLVAVSQPATESSAPGTGGGLPPEEVTGLSNGYDGASATALGVGTSGPTGGFAYVVVRRDGSWQIVTAHINNGFASAEQVRASGRWHDSPLPTIGDQYEVSMSATGSGGTFNPTSASYLPISQDRSGELYYARSSAGSGSATRNVVVTIRKIADTGESVTGTVTLTVEAEIG